MVSIWLVAGIIVLAGLINFIILALRGRWRATRKDIDDYAKGRDKLTFRKGEVVEEKEKEEEVEGRFGVLNLQTMIMGIVLIGVTSVIGYFAVSALGKTLVTNNATEGLTTTLGNVSELFPIVIVVAVAVIILSIVIQAFGSLGKLSGI